MKEIEVKILEIDKKEIEKKLVKLGAKKTIDAKVIYAKYDFSDCRIKNANNLLRLRTIGTKSYLTFKKKMGAKNSKAKIEIENEIEVSDFKTTKKILENLGLTETLRGTKHRTEYVIGKIHFEIDTLPNIPTYLEIEAPSIKIIEKYVKLLRLSVKDMKPWTAGAVERYYQEKKIKK